MTFKPGKRTTSRRGKRFSLSTLLLLAFLVGSAVQYYQTRQVSWVTDLFSLIEQKGKHWYGLASSRALAQDGPLKSLPDATDRRFDLSGTVTRVKDGDSLVVDNGGRKYEVRLHGIDAPEWKQPHGEAAKAALKRLVLYRQVHIDTVTIDSYGRTVGRLYHDHSDINLQMVRSGNAWWYRRYAATDTALNHAEDSARQQRLGLWQDARPVPPWEWRRSH